MGKIREALKAIRNKNKKLATQETIGKRLGIDQSGVSNIFSEKGGRRIYDDEIEIICEIYGISLTELGRIADGKISVGVASPAERTHPELIMVLKQLEHLRRVNRQAFDGLIGSIDSWFRASSDMPAESAPLPELEKKAKAS